MTPAVRSGRRFKNFALNDSAGILEFEELTMMQAAVGTMLNSSAALPLADPVDKRIGYTQHLPSERHPEFGNRCSCTAVVRLAGRDRISAYHHVSSLVGEGQTASIAERSPAYATALHDESWGAAGEVTKKKNMKSKRRLDPCS